MPRSISEVAMPEPVLEVNTRRAGSSRLPMDRGWQRIEIGPSASVGQISSMCACRMPSLPGTIL